MFSSVSVFIFSSASLHRLYFHSQMWERVPSGPASRAVWNSWLAMFFKHHAATKAWQDDRSAPQCIVTNKLVQRCFSLHTRCVELWYGTADEKVSASHLCFGVTIGAAISAAQSGANIQADHTCHRVMRKTLTPREKNGRESSFSYHTAPSVQVGMKIMVER